MIILKKAKVREVLYEDISHQLILIDIDGKIEKAINYLCFCNQAKKGDSVIVNTLATRLELGSGGYHYILTVLEKSEKVDPIDLGHIIKLNYTPLQSASLSAEEKDSPHHDSFKKEVDLKRKCLIIGGLHSQIAPAAAVAKFLNQNNRVVYIMTDSAALPISCSNLIRELKEKNLLDFTITTGNSFGGDYETVNIFTAIQLAEDILKADLTIITCGPGLKGTSSFFGFGAMEVGTLINTIAALNGRPIVIPRISFKDKRKRHLYISHHTLTALSIAALSSSEVIFPAMKDEDWNRINDKISKSKVIDKHKIIRYGSDKTKTSLKEFDLDVSTMGRNYQDEPYFFNAAGAAAEFALREGRL